MMNPLHLRTFLVVQRHQSFTGAAKELSLSQPAVSRHVQHLEQQLGVRLFNLVGKTPQLTEAGTALVKEAKVVLAALERAADVVRTHESNVLGTLRVGASTTPGFYVLPEALSLFSKKYPAVKVDYAVENSVQVQQMLIRNEIDLGFVGAEVQHDAVISTPLVDDQLVCFVSALHALADRHQLTPVDLADELAVIRHKGSASRRVFDAWLSEHHSKLSRTIEVHCSEALKMLVKSGLGFGFMSLRGIQTELELGTLRQLRVAGLEFHRTLQVVQAAGRPASPAATAFLLIVHSCLPDPLPPLD